MHAIARAVILASGWRRRLIAFAAGAAGALAMPPFDFLPAILVPMTIAVWLIDGCAKAGAEKRCWLHSWLTLPAFRAFGAGWWWGFGYFVAGLWWLGAAFLVDAAEFAWALPIGVAGLPAGLALFPALGFMVARLLWVPGAARLFALAAGLGLSEWLRGHAFSGFPWNSFGMALGSNLVTAQLASLAGLYGLTIITVLIFSAPAAAGGKSGFKRAIFGLPKPALAAASAFTAIYAYGALRLAMAAPSNIEGVKLRIMQPNLPQDEKFRPENKAGILGHYLELSTRDAHGGHSGLEDVSALIWPESAFPFILSRAPWALAKIGTALPPGAVLVTGAARIDGTDPASGRTLYFNSIEVLRRGGQILGTYDKVHLVPFGEYLPFQAFFDRLGLRQFVHIPGGFEAGAGRRPLSVPGLPPVAPLICYEAIFPGEVVPAAPGAERPGLLLNVTNDGWFGLTAGPYQHFAQARLRSIEEGLPLVRAANTGISAIVDPYGRIVARLALGAEGVLDGPLPRRIAAPPFARYHVYLTVGIWLAVSGTAFGARFRLK